MTGPVAEIVLMGYADPRQKAKGLQTRLWSRAFIIETLPEHHEEEEEKSNSEIPFDTIYDNCKMVELERKKQGQPFTVACGC